MSLLNGSKQLNFKSQILVGNQEIRGHLRVPVRRCLFLDHKVDLLLSVEVVSQCQCMIDSK